MAWVYDNRKGKYYWNDPEKRRASRERANQARRERRAAERASRPPRLYAAERKKKYMDMVPTLIDECDECGTEENVKLYRLTPQNILFPTTLSTEIRNGFTWESIVDEAKRCHVLCPCCVEEARAQNT